MQKAWNVLDGDHEAMIGNQRSLRAGDVHFFADVSDEVGLELRVRQAEPALDSWIFGVFRTRLLPLVRSTSIIPPLPEAELQRESPQRGVVHARDAHLGLCGGFELDEAKGLPFWQLHPHHIAHRRKESPQSRLCKPVVHSKVADVDQARIEIRAHATDEGLLVRAARASLGFLAQLFFAGVHERGHSDSMEPFAHFRCIVADRSQPNKAGDSNAARLAHPRAPIGRTAVENASVAREVIPGPDTACQARKTVGIDFRVNTSGGDPILPKCLQSRLRHPVEDAAWPNTGQQHVRSFIAAGRLGLYALHVTVADALGHKGHGEAIQDAQASAT
eukprot:scaffold1954_cov268-Pinguiococcus_pyrenoidosus.AAC.291